jgi:galactose-1-phosphate uridylyltransferase (family 1)
MQGMRAYSLEQSEKGRADACLLCDYAKAEEEKAVRVVCQNASFIAVVPWWAVVRFFSICASFVQWPYETLVLSKGHLRHLLDFDNETRRDLADILRRVACRYDNVFECSFPYSMGLHQAPCFDAHTRSVRSCCDGDDGRRNNRNKWTRSISIFISIPRCCVVRPSRNF